MGAHHSYMQDKHIWVIRLRYLISAVLAGSYILSVPLESVFHQSFSMLALAAIVTVIVAANFIWLILLRRKDIPLDSIGYYQCIFDLIVVSLIVHQYGASGLIGYLYVLVILVAGVLLPRRGIILIAASASVLYLLLLLMEVYGYTVPLPPLLGGVGLLPDNIQFLINVTIKVFFFYLIAFSASNMQDLLTKTMRESEFLESFNQGIIDMVPMGVMVLDIGRNIVVYNPSMERTTYIPVDQAMGKTIDEVFIGIDDSWDKAISQVESSGEEVRLLGSLLPVSGGKEIRVNVRISPLKQSDQVLATVCMIQTATR